MFIAVENRGFGIRDPPYLNKKMCYFSAGPHSNSQCQVFPISYPRTNWSDEGGWETKGETPGFVRLCS